MKQIDLWSALHVAMVVAGAIVGATNQDEPKKEEEPSKAENSATQSGSPKEQAIRQVVAQVQEAFNQHDSAALLKLFSKDSEIVNVHGHHVRGGEQIQEVFDDLFEQSPESTLNIQVGSIRQLSPALIIEHGTSELQHSSDGVSDRSSYTVIYAKEEGGWRMAYVRDFTLEDADDDAIQELAWLIGDWMDESSHAVVSTNYRWAENRKAIEGEFHVHASGHPDMDGTLRIAWDPQAKQLRSWVFDSEGGFSCGFWSQSEDRWMVKMSGVTRDGSMTSATNILTRDGEDQLSYRSVDRTIGGNAVPDSDEILIVRRPPQAESVSEK